MEKNKLTPKQQRFCDEYLIDFNATQACLRAGYSEKTATEQGSRLLTNVNIKAFLATQKEKTATKLEVTKESLIEDLLAIKQANMYAERGGMTAIKAIETINKMLGFNAVDKKEIEHKGGIIWNEERTYKEDK